MIRFHTLFLALLALCFARAATAQTPTSMLDSRWRLLLDRDAKWRDDPLFLPDEVELSKLPDNPPTMGGFAALTGTAGRAVTLPATVEGEFWGQTPPGALGKTPSEIVNANGNYEGVSWWYRPFTAPLIKLGERLVFNFRGARLRCEVYVNGHLCGYNIITEAPFTADATRFVKPGAANQLALRITNPGGSFSWADDYTFDWGRYKLPMSHGFGGLDSGITMEVRAPVEVSDLAVLNTPEPRTVRLQTTVASSGGAYNGPINLTLARQGKTVWSGTAKVTVAAGGSASVTTQASVPGALLWQINNAALYTARAQLPDMPNSARDTSFGFRWFTATGLGTDAKLMLNGRRIVVKSSISWGFWAPNGMFPDQAAADREVAAVRALGLNSIQNHRHMPKPIVLETFDRAGLLRYCEPGAGVLAILPNPPADAAPTQGPIDTSGVGGEPTTFTARYELAKVLAMIRENRSHPSVSMWTLQNEFDPDLHNPQIFNVLRQMRALDPSRIIALKSGAHAQDQVWSLPYSSEWMFDKGDGTSSWWDVHTAWDSAGVYQDFLYNSPTDYKYRAQTKSEISVWGEMATGASADDHAADVAWYKTQNRGGYDLAAHETLLKSYGDFLDKNGFRSVFPTTESLFIATANKHYFSAARLFENARMSDDNDYIVLSGWESTSVENHSGMVDSLRFLKGDPSSLKRAGAPLLLVVRPRRYVVAPGQNAVVDVHLVNENGIKGAAALEVSATMTGGQTFWRKTFPVNIAGGDTFGQLLQEKIEIPLKAAGAMTLTATLSQNGKALLTRTEPIFSVDPRPAPLAATIAAAGDSARLIGALQTQFGADATPFSAQTGAVKTIVAATLPGLETNYAQFDQDGLEIQNAPADASDPDLYRHQLYGGAGTLRTFRGLAQGTAKVELYFAEQYFAEAGKRVFDVALNGKAVLENFDMLKESGGKGRVLVKSFEVPVAADGKLTLSVPRVEADKASFAAMRMTDAAGKVTRVAFRGENYNSPVGEKWSSIASGDFGGFSMPDLLDATLPRVQGGAKLVLLTTGGNDAGDAAKALAARGLLKFDGMVGDEGPSWLGFWYFGRPSPLLDGLPTGVLDWQYQIAHGNGMLLSGDGVQAIIGYGINHDPRIGVGAATIAYGKGQIVLLGLPGLAQGFVSGDGRDFGALAARRLVYNALR